MVNKGITDRVLKNLAAKVGVGANFKPIDVSEKNIPIASLRSALLRFQMKGIIDHSGFGDYRLIVDDPIRTYKESLRKRGIRSVAKEMPKPRQPRREPPDEVVPSVNKIMQVEGNYFVFCYEGELYAAVARKLRAEGGD